MHTPIIPIFIPHQGCPHQCVFCNQTKITGASTTVMAKDIRSSISQALSLAGDRLPEVAYYGGSFTALPLELQLELLKPAHEFLESGRIQSIRISTRPDYINREIIMNVKSLGVTTIELGAQSLDDRVLAKASRGHTYHHIQEAVRLLREASITCGLQLMVGLPGEDWQSLIRSAQKVLALRPDFIRIYPTIVISETPLAETFIKGCYTPLTLTEAVVRCAYLKILFEYRHKITIIRTGLQASDFLEQPGAILAGPYHPSFGEMVDSYVFYLMIERVLETLNTSPIIIQHHPKDHSKLRGIRNSNITKLKEEFSFAKLEFTPNGKNINEIVVLADEKKFIINPQMLFCI